MFATENVTVASSFITVDVADVTVLWIYGWYISDDAPVQDKIWSLKQIIFKE